MTLSILRIRIWKSEKASRRAYISIGLPSVQLSQPMRSLSTCGKVMKRGSSPKQSWMKCRLARTQYLGSTSWANKLMVIHLFISNFLDESKVRMSQLNLVDLAGSEGASKTQADGLRLREGSNINRSLLALSNVINRLSTANGGKTFINFRDSKLTRILQPALGGNSKTAIICTMTGTLSNYQETLNTLHFG